MLVQCPQCKKNIEFNGKNKYRPFCSERCRLLDLGEWITEKNRIPSDETSDSIELEHSPDMKH